MIPFRDSKLTRLFQNFFCGRGKAAMIVNVNQCSSMFDETLHVFKFSAVAKQVIVNRKRMTSRHDFLRFKMKFQFLACRFYCSVFCFLLFFFTICLFLFCQFLQFDGFVKSCLYKSYLINTFCDLFRCFKLIVRWLELHCIHHLNSCQHIENFFF